MTFKNTTVQNRSKRERLNSSHTIPSHYIEGSSVPKFLLQLLELDATKEEILFSLGVQLLKNKSNPAIRRFLKEHKLKIITFESIPQNEFDLLGSAYQFLNSKILSIQEEKSQVTS